MLLPTLHHYPQSPIAEKIRMVFGMMEQEWQSVQIPRIPPKPLLMPLTGGYRRTPVLQIGADIYCDSQSIARRLCNLQAGHRAYQPAEKGLEHIFGVFGETVLFNLTVRVILTSSMGVAPEEFIQDRASLYFEPGWTVDEMKNTLSSTLLQLQSTFDLINDHLLAHGPYMNGQQPSYADAVIQHCVWFLCERWDGGENLVKPFEAICRNRELITAIGHGSPTELSAEQALQIAKDHIPHSPKGIFFNYLGGLTQGQMVSIRQHGTTSDPDVTGILRYLDNSTIAIDYEHPDIGLVAIHFPVLGYQISSL